MKRIAGAVSIAAIAAAALAIPAVAATPTPTSAAVSWGFTPMYGTPSTATSLTKAFPSTGLLLARTTALPQKATVLFKWTGTAHNVVIVSGDQTSKSLSNILKVTPVAASAGTYTSGATKGQAKTTGSAGPYTYNFTTAGTYTVYCAVSIHYNAGMKKIIKVS